MSYDRNLAGRTHYYSRFAIAPDDENEVFFLTAAIPGFPPWGTVSNIEPSRYDSGTAYITVDFHQVNNRDPYVSFDDGGTWRPLQSGLPHAPVHWITVQEHFNDLVVATYGRGFWILDDISPLQQLTSEVLAKSSHLMAPRAAYRFIPITEPMADSDDQTQGVNPPYGASLNYYLKAATEGDVKLEIKDAKGETVRTLDGTKEAGINRVWWDLDYEPSKELKLRTKPLYAPWVKMGDDGTRAYAGFGGRVRVRVPPGTYTVTLKVGSETSSQSLEVRKDPNSEGTPADIVTQTARLLAIRDDMNAVVGMIDQLEWTRKQLYDLKDLHKEDEAVVKAADELDKKLIAVEEGLHEMKQTGRGQDALRWPSRLVFKLSHLANGIATADFAPTTQQIAVHEMFQRQIAELKGRLDSVLSTDLDAFNAVLTGKGFGSVFRKTS